MNSIQDKLDKLYKEWQKKYILSKDGILDENIYWKKIPRITFLLKETYGEFINIAPLPCDSKDGYGPDGGSPWFWRNLRSWQYVIEKKVEQVIKSKNNNIVSTDLKPKEVKKIMETPLTGVGYVNIKKVVGESISDWPVLHYFAKSDASFLKKELRLLKPHIIFCCGYQDNSRYSNFEFLKIIDPKFKKATQLSNSVYEKDGILAIDWWHPSCRNNFLKWDQLILEDHFSHPRVLKKIKELGWNKE
jgi:hypothetical protein